MTVARWVGPVAWSLFSAAAPAQDAPRFVERTPLPVFPPAHTMQRAGSPGTVAWWAVPGGGRAEAGGYVGGRRPGFGPGPATGPAVGGTVGWDFVGFRVRAGRVFLAPSPDPAAGPPIARNYRTDGPPHIPDVISVRPFRRAVLEKKDAAGDRK